MAWSELDERLAKAEKHEEVQQRFRETLATSMYGMTDANTGASTAASTATSEVKATLLVRARNAELQAAGYRAMAALIPETGLSRETEEALLALVRRLP